MYLNALAKNTRFLRIPLSVSLTFGISVGSMLAACARAVEPKYAPPNREAPLEPELLEPEIDTRFGQPTPVDIPYFADSNAGDIVINIKTRRLYVNNGDGTARVYPIAIGKSNRRSPTGSFTVTDKRENPCWTPTPRMRAKEPWLKAVKGGDPKNPLGPRKLYFGNSYYGIHGTPHRDSIGKAASHGCFRMFNEDILDLYDRVPVNAKVTVVDKADTPLDAYMNPNAALTSQ